MRFFKTHFKWCENYSNSGRSPKKPQILYVLVFFLFMRKNIFRGILGIYALVRKSEQYEGRSFEKTSGKLSSVLFACKLMVCGL